MRLLLLLPLVRAYKMPDAKAFATFGNSQTKEFISRWQPAPLPIEEGDTMLPQSKETMKRYVRARILLEDPGVGCIASFDEGLNVILCRFHKGEHSLILPLWQPSSAGSEEERPKTFSSLTRWHREAFEDTRLSGVALEWNEDRKAWADSFDI